MSVLDGASRGGDGGGLSPTSGARGLLAGRRDNPTARLPNAAGPPPRPLFLDAGTKPPPLEGLVPHEIIVCGWRESAARRRVS